MAVGKILGEYAKFVGRNILKDIFPGYYEIKQSKESTKKKKTKKKAKSQQEEKIDDLEDTVSEQNVILNVQAGILAQEVVILTEILNELKSLKLGGGLADLLDLLDIPDRRNRKDQRKTPQEEEEARQKKTPQQEEEERARQKQQSKEPPKEETKPKETPKSTEKEKVLDKAKQRGTYETLKKIFQNPTLRKRFFEYLARKGLGGLVARISARIALIAGAGWIPIAGWVLDAVLVVLSIADVIEIMQYVEEFVKEEQNTPEEDNSKSLMSGSKADLTTDKKEQGKAVVFHGEKILFKAQNLRLTAQSLTLSDAILAQLLLKGAPTLRSFKALSGVGEGESIASAAVRTGSQPPITPGTLGKVIGGGPEAAKEAPELDTITSKSNQSTKVAKQYAGSFQGFINDLEKTGYNITSLGGYNYRPNTSDPSKLSYHGLGAAIDINPSQNPYGGKTNNLPQETAALAAQNGLGWGISFNDPMHFSAAKKEGGAYDIAQRPMYASGTPYVGKTETATVGELGPEVIIKKDGTTTTTPSGPAPLRVDKGDMIIPSDNGVKPIPFGKNYWLSDARKDPTLRGGLQQIGGEENIIVSPETTNILLKRQSGGMYVPPKNQDKGFEAYRNKILMAPEGTYPQINAQGTKISAEHEIGHAASTKYMMERGYSDTPNSGYKGRLFSQDFGGGDLEEARQRTRDLEHSSDEMTQAEKNWAQNFINDYAEYGLENKNYSPEDVDTYTMGRQRFLSEINKDMDRYFYEKTSIDFLEANGGHK